MNLYRARYTWPSGEVSHVTFASTPRDALRWAADYVRAFVQGELLSITEQHSITQIRMQLTLV